MRVVRGRELSPGGVVRVGARLAQFIFFGVWARSLYLSPDPMGPFYMGVLGPYDTAYCTERGVRGPKKSFGQAGIDTEKPKTCLCGRPKTSLCGICVFL